MRSRDIRPPFAALLMVLSGWLVTWPVPLAAAARHLIDPDRVEVWSEQDRVHPDPFGMASAVGLRSAGGWAGPTTTHSGR